MRGRCLYRIVNKDFKEFKEGVGRAKNSSIFLYCTYRPVFFILRYESVLYSRPPIP
jgi:hypothetical protein